MANASGLLEGESVGRGSLARAAAMIYWFLTLELLAVLTCLPSIIWWLILPQNINAVPLAVLGLLPFGPTLSALLFAWRRRDIEGADLTPSRRFWRGWRLNVVDVLAWWIPLVLFAAIVSGAINASVASGLPLRWPLFGILLIGGVWSCHFLLCASLFSFRRRDNARIASYLTFRKPLVSLGYLSLIFLLLAAAFFVGVPYVLLGLSLGSFFFLRTANPAIKQIESEFIKHDEPDTAAAETWADADVGTGSSVEVDASAELDASAEAGVNVGTGSSIEAGASVGTGSTIEAEALSVLVVKTETRKELAE